MMDNRTPQFEVGVARRLGLAAIGLVVAPLALLALGPHASAAPNAPSASARASASAAPSAASSTAPAAGSATGAADSDAKERARALYRSGVKAVEQLEWAEALNHFEASYALVPNANTSLNIGVCERALGRLLLARMMLTRALAENDAGGGQVLDGRGIEDAKSYLKEAESSLVHAKVTVHPEGVSLTVDGRPISSFGDGLGYAAGVDSPGPGAPVPAGTFDLTLDPGNHVFLLSLKGFGDAVSKRDFTPGSTPELTFELERLPAAIHINADVDGALVKVGAIDVGPVPVEVLRPAGTYPVVVQKEGYVPYETSLTVRPGEQAKIDAILPKAKLNVATQWWFWTSVVGALGTAAVATYFAVRPEPEPPPYDGGTTGWVVGQAMVTF
ncbi:MAG: PEGA domain-containing protein [Polyangiaceae bacterium]